MVYYSFNIILGFDLLVFYAAHNPLSKNPLGKMCLQFIFY